MKVQIDLKLALEIVEKLAEIRSITPEKMIPLNDISDRLKQSICEDNRIFLIDTPTYSSKPRLEQNEPYRLSMRIDLKTGERIAVSHEKANRRINYNFNDKSGILDLLVDIGPME